MSETTELEIQALPNETVEQESEVNTTETTLDGSESKEATVEVSAEGSQPEKKEKRKARPRYVSGLGKLSAQELLEDRKHTTIKNRMEIYSSQMQYLLQREIEPLMSSANRHTPLMLAGLQDKSLQKQLTEYHKGIQEGTNQFLDNWQMTLDIFSSSEEIQERLSCIESQPRTAFNFVFTHNFFWQYISLIKKYDRSFAKLDEIDLCGGLEPEQYSAMKDELVKGFYRLSRGLEYLGKVNRRRDGNKSITVERLKKLNENYWKVMGLEG
jgi:hypothetical protein